MLLPASYVALLALCLTAGVASPPAAQQPSSPQAPLPPAPISCDAVKKNMDGDWVTKQDMMLPGPTGPVQIKAGIPLNDDLQDDLDGGCKGPRGPMLTREKRARRGEAAAGDNHDRPPPAGARLKPLKAALAKLDPPPPRASRCL